MRPRQVGHRSDTDKGYTYIGAILTSTLLSILMFSISCCACFKDIGSQGLDSMPTKFMPCFIVAVILAVANVCCAAYGRVCRRSAIQAYLDELLTNNNKKSVISRVMFKNKFIVLRCYSRLKYRTISSQIKRQSLNK